MFFKYNKVSDSLMGQTTQAAIFVNSQKFIRETNECRGGFVT